MPVVESQACIIYSDICSRERNVEPFTSLAVHGRQLANRAIQNLGEHASIVLLDHAAQSIIGNADSIDADWVVVGIPTIAVEGAVLNRSHISIRVVLWHRSARYRDNSVGCTGVSCLKRAAS